MPATILNYLCNEMKKEPYQLFDSVGGTSIGGMLALTIVGTKDGHTPLADKDTL
jgi:patatin-like phospholipase/acyl hydrolase